MVASIEFKIYAAGASVPYISYRLKNILITSFKSVGASNGGPVIESVSFNFQNYGFMDWVNSVSFGYNVRTGAPSAY